MNTATTTRAEILSQAANEARGLAIDAIHACSSGHLGLPLGCAEIGAVLFGDNALRYNPAAPKWLNRGLKNSYFDSNYRMLKKG